ncbi:hypothetical protein KSGM81_01887 [Klebsiella quasipneumoniae]|jgi:hypothetical protein|nr:hypothetical protein SM66_02958 [Klebsiella quasipneumoniae subsp. quasipneumoniae]KMH48380.1 hypothetical protein SM73_03312 [Klebsiella quasipneumoniae]CDQ15019.1 hypothetical protein KQQSB11_300167 [Klebsiella quasipneumoniae subsp. quasipneumoniae]SAX27336.1 Uncharacterised protein [Klebsiella quasipneumoniae]SBZ98234.1 Uncharacterised protein [Klebsiella quasipneumoniae]
MTSCLSIKFKSGTQAAGYQADDELKMNFSNYLNSKYKNSVIANYNKLIKISLDTRKLK